MTKQPLESLAQIRTSAVDEAQLALQQAQARKADAEQLLVEISRDLERASAGAAFEAVQSVQDYLWRERQGQAQRLRLRRAEARHGKAQVLHAQALEGLRSAQARLIDAELGRRAPALILARREAALLRAAELRREEEAEDAHRSRRA